MICDEIAKRAKLRGHIYRRTSRCERFREKKTVWEFGAGGEWSLSHNEQGTRAGAHRGGPSVSYFSDFQLFVLWISQFAPMHRRRVLRGCVGVGGDGLFRYSNACSGCCLMRGRLTAPNSVWLCPQRQRQSRRRTRESICGVHAQK